MNLKFNPELFRELLILIGEAFDTDPNDEKSRSNIRASFAELSAKLTSFEDTKTEMIQLGETLAHDILESLKMLREKAEVAPVTPEPEVSEPVTPEPESPETGEESETPSV
jgi:hypothetical protein